MTKAADIFSLGILLQEMYCGPRQRCTSNQQEVQMAGGCCRTNEQGVITLPQDCPARFRTLVQACTHPDLQVQAPIQIFRYMNPPRSPCKRYRLAPTQISRYMHPPRRPGTRYRLAIHPPRPTGNKCPTVIKCSHVPKNHLYHFSYSSGIGGGSHISLWFLEPACLLLWKTIHKSYCRSFR
jgi:hypothetical protein